MKYKTGYSHIPMKLLCNWLDAPETESLWGRDFRDAFPAHPASCTTGTGCFVEGEVKQLGRNVDHPYTYTF